MQTSQRFSAVLRIQSEGWEPGRHRIAGTRELSALNSTESDHRLRIPVCGDSAWNPRTAQSRAQLITEKGSDPPTAGPQEVLNWIWRLLPVSDNWRTKAWLRSTVSRHFSGGSQNTRYGQSLWRWYLVCLELNSCRQMCQYNHPRRAAGVSHPWGKHHNKGEIQPDPELSLLTNRNNRKFTDKPLPSSQLQVIWEGNFFFFFGEWLRGKINHSKVPLLCLHRVTWFNGWTSPTPLSASPPPSKYKCSAAEHMIPRRHSVLATIVTYPCTKQEEQTTAQN